MPKSLSPSVPSRGSAILAGPFRVFRLALGLLCLVGGQQAWAAGASDAVPEAPMSVPAEAHVPKVHQDLHRHLQQEQATNALFQALADSVTNQRSDEEPFELFPALDLYTDWDDLHVDPLIGKKGITIPDEADIDVSHFYAPIQGRINSPYGWRRRRMHKGTDIKLYTGDTVRAAFNGRVRIRKFDRRGYGYYLVLRHPNGLETVYGHLSRFLVNADDLVRAGDPIALGGSTGRSTGPHLHFETRYMGIAIDPGKIIDFNTFEPKSPTFHFVRKTEQRAQTGASGGGASSAGASASGEAAYYRVKKGDTLGKIARVHGTSVARLCKLNGIRSNSTLRIGQRIRYR